MSDGISRADGEHAADEDPVHVFDQTNGVLGPDQGDDDEPATGVTPPSKFGVPPIVSL
jgi:hypothetical protein